jgi:hypothetical protein
MLAYLTVPVEITPSRKGMKMKTLSKIIGSVAAGFALLAASGTASALTYQGAEFSSSVSGAGTSWTLVMTMDFTNADANNEFLGDMMEAWSLTLPGAATIKFTDGSLVGWAINNNAQADASGCGGGQVNAICVDWGTLNVINGGGPQIDKGDKFTFSIDILFAEAQNYVDDWGNFHLLSVRQTDCPGQQTGTCYKKDGGLISQPLSSSTSSGGGSTGGGTSNGSVPESGSTLTLLGLGLLGLGFSRRMKSAKH